MEFKGTKGKWFLAAGDNPKLRVSSEYMNEDEDICECLCQYDAALISAAPDLLEALQELTNSDLFENIIHINARAGGKKQLAEAWLKATKAIDKALDNESKPNY